MTNQVQVEYNCTDHKQGDTKLHRPQTGWHKTAETT